MTSPQPVAAAPRATKFLRFAIEQRVEHIFLLVSFSLLGLTGLIQKFPLAPISDWLITALGGIETVRIIHRTNAIIMVAIAIYHVAELGYRLFVMRRQTSMAPGPADAAHVIQDVLVYLGLRQHTARYGRYTYAEKMEYWAMIWGTLIMAITGFILWNPIAVAKFLPGEIIPASKAAHGAEAILAVLAIILWHFYNVHLKVFNKSIFTGTLTREEMLHEHPAELAHLEGPHGQPPAVAPEIRRRRQLIYWPVAVVVVGGLALGLWRLSTNEVTAITTIPTAESATIYVPFTPTPSPAPTVTPTPPPANASLTWDTGIGQLFADRCGACHGASKSGGLGVENYAEVLQGGSQGPGIVIGNPDGSVVIQVQSAGGHPGQFSAEELAQVTEWIKLGAPEK